MLVAIGCGDEFSDDPLAAGQRQAASVHGPIPDDQGEGAKLTVTHRAIGVLGKDFSYTLDGGRRWNIRRVDFPSAVTGFSLPTADTGYVVGSHGLVYRYRVVPFAYSVPRMLTISALTPLPPDGL